MKPSEALFDLIHSLSQSEKRHFKLYSTMQVKGKQNTYTRLFDAIDRQNEYNEAAIKQQFRNEPFIRQLTFTKNYLYNAILKSLTAYHRRFSVDMTIRDLLQQVEVLFHKRLYKQCHKLLKKTDNIAAMHERHMERINIMDWQRRIIKARKYEGTTEEEMKQLLEGELKCVKKQQNLLETQDLHDRFFRQGVREGIIPRKDKRWARIYKEVEKRFIGKEDTMLSNDARSSLYEVVGRYYHSQGDIENSSKYYNKHITLMQSYPGEQLQEKMDTYLTAFHNYMIIQVHQKKWNKLTTLLKEFRAIEVNTIELEVEKFLNSYVLESEVYIVNGAFENTARVVKAMEEGLKKYSSKIHKERQHLLHYNMALLCFGAADYSGALRWLNAILFDSQKDLRPDIYSFAKIVSLIVHFERGNSEELNYYVKSAYRFLYRKNYLFKLEQLIIDFIRKQAKDPLQGKGIKIAFEKAHADLMELYRDPQEKKVQMYFDFQSWIESKFTGKTFPELVREKAFS